jgi:FtsP/CotA-like multicopper oxidase with cupredoxin domain
LIAASAATNFFIDTGNLDATISATDGENVKPLKGNFLQLAVAQRLDPVVTIPATGGLFPILALGEGSNLQTGFLLATPGVEIPKPALGIRGKRMMDGLIILRRSVLRRKNRFSSRRTETLNAE